jgi:hypothetical protein
METSREISVQLSAVLKIVYEHTDEGENEIDLLIERKGNNLLLRNIDYNPDKPLLTETLTILLKNVVNKFSPAITKMKIVATEKVPRYQLWPWPKKTIGQEFSAAVEEIILRGGRIIIKPQNPQEAGELRQLLLLSQDHDNKEVWIDPIITGLDLNLEKIQIDEK